MTLRAAAVGTAYVVTSFFLLPGLFGQLNRVLGFPMWKTDMGQLLGGLLILGGIGVLIYCSRLFARIGFGTPVPVDPPRRLVGTGLYRYSRNPIYVADVAILLGIFLVRGELLVLLYVLLFAVAIHFWVVRREEPELRLRFGDEYVEYTLRVPRWLGWPRGV
jgi:protein-S-isoprenylcysteine O-methyltransferase Ste14